MKKIALITVDYNGHDDTRELLKSFGKIKQTKDFNLKWFVVDNGSETPLSDVVSENKDLELLQTGVNKGFTGGYNAGIRYAYHWGADYFLLVNNDVLFGDPYLIQRLVESAESNPAIGLISPKIYFAPGYEFFKDRYAKKDVGKVLWYAGGTFDWLNIMSRHRGIDEVDKGRYDRTEKTGFTTGCCLLIPRLTVDKVGVFDERYFAYFEDNDYQKRVVDSGLVLVYVGGTFIYHKVSRTSQIGSEFSDYMLTKNRLFFGMKYASLRTKIALTREALKLLMVGRPAQRRGVVDALSKRYGPAKAPAVRENAKYAKRLSIVVLNHKTCELVVKLLESIYKTSSGFDSQKDEIILLDNGSQDGSLEEIGRRFGGVRLIAQAENIGFTRGNNVGIEYTKGEFILLLNSDIEVLPGSLPKLVECAKRFKSGAVIVGKLQFPNGQYQDSCFDLPSAAGAFREYFLRQKGKYFMYRPPDGEPVRVEAGVMACFLIPRIIMNRVGKLWEKAFSYFEDVDYCRRLKEQNIPVYYCSEAVFIHHHGATSKKIGQDKAFAMLQEASIKYHGYIGYALLYLVLWVGQKISLVKTPQSSWAKPSK